MIFTSRLMATLAIGLGLSTFVSAHDGDPKLRDKQPAYAGPGWRNAQRTPQGGGSSAVMQPPIAFPHNNVTLLSWLTLADFGVPGSGNGNSCFGYVSPSGREYAIMGHSNGTAFVEVTQPGNATLVAQIAGPQSLWRDIRTYSTYAYAISEGGGGIQVMNLTNIDSGVVTLSGTVNDDATSSTHTLAVDPVSGFLYRSGGNTSGLRIYDVHTNPAVPTRVGSWSNIYVHEPAIFTFTSGPAAGKQIAYCCGGLNGGFNSTGLYTVDVTNKAAPAQTSFVTYANSGYCHQAWPSSDMQFLYLDDELDDENLGITSLTRVFSLANPLIPAFVGTFTTGSTSIDHNQYTRADRIYQSNYRSGLHVWQTSSPGTQTNPVEIAYFDTYPQDDATLFNGLWNNYPYFPSGTVIGSDIERGLFVWWIGAPQITFALPGSPASISPAGQALRVQITGAFNAGTAKLHYNIGAGFVTADLVQAPDLSYYASIPPTSCGTKIQYYFSAQSPNNVIWTDPEAAPTQLYTLISGQSAVLQVDETFETATAGWVAGAAGDTATTGIWTRVNPVGTAAQAEDDHTPGAGTMCWVTGQGTVGGADGAADVDGGATTLLTPTFDLSSFSGAKISYWRWFDNSVSAIDDSFKVDVSNNNGTSWVNVETIGPGNSQIGVDGAWIYHEIVLSDFVPITSQVKLRFVASDTGSGSVLEAGVDDFQIRGTRCSGVQSFCLGDGTGAACPCANYGAAGSGCASSIGTGALLATSGSPSIAVDTLSLDGSGMPSSTSVLYLQGDGADGGGLGAMVGDGLRCVGGTIVRLGTKMNAGGASSYPSGSTVISVRGGVLAGQTRFYQAWFRNAASFCTSETYNWSNGVIVSWAP